MQIIDKYGYLESALDYIEGNIVSGKGLQKIAARTGIKENSLRTLSLALKSFSEGQFIVALQEKIEESHSSLAGADAEILGADISVEVENHRPFILMKVSVGIVIDGEQEDSLKLDIKILPGKNNIKIT